ncbi:hypothetical protein GLAREA_04396 [Glarea lozoyensis ATCC 20868]|uniref:Uncharacterized protein n=1 Tax=Glarea lozoyensis (strain ATCC 20868 / MF5171) TaxID=1116229 RepID=S3CPH8_GLAL2|nr:uncharacterized protein GLAREA_04396 [Glarea lozoyensis ATCC 20868]EPE27605.1 hypothetical protein GLAREA_04396 [Glarea lozoyensis ATCC 20868]
MATDFAMPVQQFTASPTQYTLYNNTQSQPISPINSANATPGASPTSPRTAVPAHVPAVHRQLRPQKSPLYVPAVLRPTDPPKRAAKPTPLTPPQSMHSSFDDLDNSRGLNRRSTDENGKLGLGSIVESEFNTEGLGKVTALPTKEHWKIRKQIIIPKDTAVDHANIAGENIEPGTLQDPVDRTVTPLKVNLQLPPSTAMAMPLES